MSFQNKVTNIQPLVPGGTTVITLGTGGNAPTLDMLQLTLGAGSGTFNDTKVNAIRGYINGRLFFNGGTGVEYNARGAYLDRDLSSGGAAELMLNFTEPNAKSGVEQFLSAIPLKLIQDFRIELDVDATASAALTLQALAHFRAPTANPFIKKYFKVTQSFAAGGEQVVYMPAGPSGGKLVRVWIHESVAGNITAVQLLARNSIGIEGTRTQIENNQKRNHLVPQSGVFVLDFIADGNLAGWFDTGALSDVELRLTGTAAATYTIYYEYLDPIARL
jgi:hypothetical protein